MNIIETIFILVIVCFIVFGAGHFIIQLIKLAKLLIENIYYTIKFQRLPPEERKKARKKRVKDDED